MLPLSDMYILIEKGIDVYLSLKTGRSDTASYPEITNWVLYPDDRKIQYSYSSMITNIHYMSYNLIVY